MSNWFVCKGCNEEFSVVTVYADICYCPCCGAPIEHEDEELDEEQSWEIH